MVSRWLSVWPSAYSSVRLSYARPSIFSFPDDNLNVNGFSPKLAVCIDIVEILFRMAIGQIFFWQLSTGHTSLVSFPGDNFSKYQ